MNKSSFKAVIFCVLFDKFLFVFVVLRILVLNFRKQGIDIASAHPSPIPTSSNVAPPSQPTSNNSEEEDEEEEQGLENYFQLAGQVHTI